MKNVEYAVLISNLTSKTEIPVKAHTKLIELGDDWLLLEVPVSSCSKGHKLAINILPKTEAKKATKGQAREKIPGVISITATVEQSHELPEEADLIRVKFVQYLKAQWSDFLKEWNQIQERVNKQFKSIKE